MKVKIQLSLMIFLVSIGYAYSQNTTLTAQGVMFPQFTTVQINALINPPMGTLVYNTTTNSYWYRQSSAWSELPQAGSTSNYWNLTGTAGNEIKNTNSGGIWTSGQYAFDYQSDDQSHPPTAPASGAGTRLMWIPARSAFRVGSLTDFRSTDWNANNIGLFSTAIGLDVKASGLASNAIGSYVTASGRTSTAIGANLIASGNASLALGSGNIASGDHSTVLGGNNTASGYYSTATGVSTLASGSYSFTQGDGSHANGYTAVAIGNLTKAPGSKSFASGQETTASGENSMSLGRSTQAVGLNSLAAGTYNIANADHSVAFGEKNIARSNNSLALGIYNKDYFVANPDSPNRFLLSIGNGSNEDNRRNCFEVRQTGTVQLNHYNPAQDNPDRYGLRIKRDIATDSQFWTLSHPSNENLDIHYGASGAFKAYVRQSDGAWMQSSDIRLKEQIKPVESILEKVSQLKVSRYFYKTDTLHTNLQMGLIAQEVQPLFPEFITQNGQYYGVNYGGMSVVALKAIQELKAENEKLKTELQNHSIQFKELYNQLKAEIEIVKKINGTTLNN
jgi:trimeric autotransporter adhesin